MPFPDSPRVMYAKNPLKEVICQITFPAVLRIDSELPARFQEQLRDTYPIFREEQGATLNISLPPGVHPEGKPLSLGGVRALYRFISEDQNWTVTLSRESLAMTTKSYTSWEEFKEHFQLPLEAFLAEYQPSFFTRIGLRYVNLINRNELGLKGCPWSELLKSPIAGELSSPDIADNIRSSANQLTIALEEEGSFVLMNHGLVTNDNSNLTENFSYLIDNDFSTANKTEANNVINRLNYFNRYSGRVFQWCITERLHDALEPQPF